MSWIPLQKVFKQKDSTKKSMNYYTVMPSRVHLRRNFEIGPFDLGEPLIEEVEYFPVEAYHTLPVQQLIDRPVGTVSETLEQFAHRVTALHVEDLEAGWLPDRQPVALVSSGWDSRWLMHCLRLIRDKGEINLENLLFVTSSEEGVVAQQALQVAGWEPERLYFYRSEMLNGDYWLEALDMSTIWPAHNGPRSIPLNYSWLPFIAAKRDGFLLEPWKSTVIYGGSNSPWLGALEPSGNKFGAKFNWWWTTQESSFKYPAKVCQTCRYVPLLEACIDSTVRLGRPTPRQVLQIVAPDLAKFPNLLDQGENYEVWKTKETRYLSPEALAYAKTQYAQSTYGREVYPEGLQLATNEVHYHRWWSRWSSATIMERLLALRKEVYIV